jgi:hypothetical protein
MSLRKYPRTRHVAGSRLQPGDEDLESVPFRELLGRHVVVEEKMDGANCAFSFGPDADLRLQSRGHYLVGGPRERHFDLFKRWANHHAGRLLDVIGDRYVVYGEWLHAKHTVFYDALPHYFMEFDVLDLEADAFLDTPRRAALLHGLPVVPVRVLFSGVLEDEAQLRELVGASAFVTPDAPRVLRETAARMSLDPELVTAQSDVSGLMEGLYLKVEADGVVVDRLKFVRHAFVQQLQQADGHWQERPIVPNQLADGVDLFEGGPS